MIIGSVRTAGGQNGQLGAIFLKNDDRQCTQKLQKTPKGGLVDTHGAEIGLLKFSVMIGTAGSAVGKWEVWAQFSSKMGMCNVRYTKITRTPRGALSTCSMVNLDCKIFCDHRQRGNR